MNFKTWVPFFISILVRKFASALIKSTDSADEYNIAKDLNDTIVGIFQSVEPQNVARLIDTLTNLNESSHCIRSTDNVNTTFHHIQVIKVISDDTRIHYDFPNNEMKIRSNRFIVKITGFITLDNDSSWYFESKMNFRNIIIKVSKKDYSVATCVPSFDTVNIELVGNASANSKVSKLVRNSLPALLNENINKNVRFLQFLEETYNILTKKRIISKHGDFSVHENRYHHLIPNITFTSYVLKNIIIKGLSNFHSLHNTENPLTYILITKNIGGSLDLKDDSDNSILQFNIGILSISVEQKNNVVRVAAQNYSVTDSRTNIPFSELHSAAIMELIEATIAWSIMPSMEFQRTMKPRPGSDLHQTKISTPLLTTTTQLPTKSKFKPTTTQLPNKTIPQNSTSITKLQTTTKSKSSSTAEQTESSTRLIVTRTPFQTKPKPTITQLTNKRAPSTVVKAINPETTMKPRTVATSQKTESSTRRILPTTRFLQTKPTTTTKNFPNTPPSQAFNIATKKSPESVPEDLLNYHLLFNDVNIKLILVNQSYPENLECDLQNNLKFTHKINTLPIGSTSNQVNVTAINFHANISSINISVIKLNKTKDNDSCQFQIHINQIIDVQPSYLKNTTTQSGIQHRIKKKIDAMLKGAREDRDRIIQIVKPKVCSTLDVCSQSVKIAKAVFLNYVDTILKKCSLRRSSTT